MPRKAPTQCRTLSCPGLHHGTALEFKGYCEPCSPAASAAHALKYRKVSQRRREQSTTLDRFYATKEWRACRNAHIKREPLCRHCGDRGRTKPADVVDHIVERKDGGSNFANDNLQSLCHTCHNTKTGVERRKRNRNE